MEKMKIIMKKIPLKHGFREDWLKGKILVLINNIIGGSDVTRSTLILLLALLFLQAVVATPQNYRKAQAVTDYFRVHIVYPEEAYIGDTVRIEMEINVTRESEVFEIYISARLITPEDYEWGVPLTYPRLISRLKNLSSGYVWRETFVVNATDVGVVLMVIHVRCGNLILGKPIPIKTDSTVIETVPCVPEHSYAVAFVLTKVKTRLEETIELLKGKIELLEERLGRLQREYIELRASYTEIQKKYSQLSREHGDLKERFEDLQRKCISLEGECNMLRENVKTLTRLNTLYSTGFYLLLAATIVLIAYCLSLRRRLRRIEKG